MDVSKLEEYTIAIEAKKMQEGLDTMSNKDVADLKKPKITKPWIVQPAARCYDCALPICFYTSMWRKGMDHNVAVWFMRKHYKTTHNVRYNNIKLS